MPLPLRLVAALAALLAAPAALAQTPDAALEVQGAGQAPGEWLFRVNVNAGAVLGGVNIDGAGTSDITGFIPVEGAGTRLMWYPEKGAFRAGEVRAGITRYEDPLPVLTTGTEWDDVNVGSHSVALGQSSRASGDYAFAMGFGSYATAPSAVAIGEANNATGAASVAMGYHAHTNARQGSFVFGDRSSVDLIRAGVNHSANWRVSGGFRIFTSSNLSTGVTIQSGASVSNWGQANAVISTSTGALLTTGGVWTNVSDRNRKHRFEAVDGEDVLARLRALPLSTWSYRAEPDAVRHLGPTAQDFRAAFGLGQDSLSIGTVDADGVALAAAQALEARTRAQEARIAALEAELAALRAGRSASPVQAALPALGVLALLGLAGVGLRRRGRRPE
jgi:hypothetical protein